MSAYVFDIETGPAEHFRPDPLPPLPEFDPESVKVGNLKDPKKIQEKIDKAEADYAAKQKSWYEDDRAFRDEQIKKACMSPLLGRIHAIGVDTTENHNILTDANGEGYMLEQFWQIYEGRHNSGDILVGFNINDFDIPFIWQRSLIMGLRVPPSVLEQNRYWSRTFVDLAAQFSGGSRKTTYVKLNDLCEAIGIEGKPDHPIEDRKMHGGDFWKFWTGTEEDKKIATDYLRNDLRMERELATYFGVY